MGILGAIMVSQEGIGEPSKSDVEQDVKIIDVSEFSKKLEFIFTCNFH